MKASRFLPGVAAVVIALGVVWMAGFVEADPNKGAVIDFEGLPAGTIVTELSSGSGISGDLAGVVKVSGYNGVVPAEAAMVFDSSCPPGYVPADCSGPDDDLGTPNEQYKFKPLPGSPIPGPGHGDGGATNRTSEGNVLILTEDFDAGDPNDADNEGMYLDFDFRMALGGTEDTVNVDSLAMLDIETDQGEAGTFAEFWTGGETPLDGPPSDMLAIAPSGDNGRTDIKNIKLDGVSYMRINFNGSGAMIGAVFGGREPGSCWTTTGGFQNAGFASGSKDYTFGGNVGPPPSGVWEVVDHVTGDNFHSNDVEIIECLVAEALSGPEQPGGKKGLEENVLRFRGTGRLRHGDTGEVTEGHVFQGCVIDAGEPAGSQGLDSDYYEIVVCDLGETECDFGSGLCSAETTPDQLTPTASQDACDGLGDPVVFAACGRLDGGNVQIHPPVGPGS